jgi:hypothetical protein
MAKQRIVVTCPETGVAVITNIAYEDVAQPRETPMLFACPCGAIHTLQFGGHARRYRPTPPPCGQHGGG